MFLTIERVNKIMRICCLVAFSALAGTLVLLFVSKPTPSVLMPVMPSNHAFDVEPVRYPGFDELTPGNEDPFDFQDNIYRKRSFIVVKPPEKREFKPEPVISKEPEPDLTGLRLLATIHDGHSPRAIIENTLNNTGLLTVTIGDSINNAAVAKISRTGVTVITGKKTRELVWENPWQKDFEKLMEQSPRSSGLTKENQDRDKFK